LTRRRAPFAPLTLTFAPFKQTKTNQRSRA
jgi:hypothetical protein